MLSRPPSNPNDIYYRPGVGVMLVNKHSQVFVAKRIDNPTEAWQMPQGGIDKNEIPLEAAMRELKEEIGTNNATVLSEYPEWLYYDIPEELAKKLWDGKYQGQRQYWFLMRFEGQDDEININTIEPEFNEWRWCVPEQIVDLIVPFKRDLYIQVLEAFHPYLKQGNV